MATIRLAVWQHLDPREFDGLPDLLAHADTVTRWITIAEIPPVPDQDETPCPAP